ncbi:hypothetical protein CWR48_13785 [Oceanobacillus arenosus]|uniref:Uncharacterized protein n=1 Tax=Oceanobacillus arenosus TaxID=1229153 RepID=A0A3D8PNA7_9BACI|nr:hypothetical protein [Oceanobacillus arenosus]RDW17586.1 hypothetical protein CWR48_13785 [Oceanobacillus arenosus]
MRKIALSILLFVLLLAACSSDDSSEGTDTSNEITSVEAPQPESLFTYEFSEDDRFEFTGIDSSIDASTVLFSTKEEIKREEERSKYVIFDNKEAVNVKEISEASAEELEDRSCSRTFVSPDGKYLTFSCSMDERWFVIYDTEEQKIVHHEQELDDISLDIFGITNDMEILLENNDGNIIAIYNLETKGMKEFVIPELSGIEDDAYTDLIPADNGKKVFMHNFLRLSVLDTETGKLEEIMNVEPYQERFKDQTEGIIIDSLKVSPNGNYAFFRLDDTTSKDEIYQSINFVNMETGEITSFTDYDYQRFGTIDDNGNMILSDSEQVYLYNFDNKTNYHIPNVAVGVYTEYLTISGDGKHLLYADRIRDSEETPAYELFHLPINELDSYEAIAFNATEENTKELLGELNTNDKKNGAGIAVNPIEEDVRKMFEEKWNQSATIPFPSSFPEEVASISDHIHSDSFGQTIQLNAAEITKRNEINFSANSYPDDDRKNYCINDDLELTETIDGIDYYFYLFSNEEVELAFVKDDWCYSIEGEGFTQQEMFDIADSMETQGKRPAELPLDDVKFAGELPNKHAKISSIHVSKHGTDNYVFDVDYRGEQDELKINYEAAKSEPTYYEDEETIPVELENSLEAHYNEPNLRLFVFDGTYYYMIEADVKNDLVNELGGKDKIKDALVGVGNSLN